MKRRLCNLLVVIVLFPLFIHIPCSCASLEIKRVLRVASELVMNSRLLIKLTDNGKYSKYKGFVKDFTEELVNILGYQYEIVVPNDPRSTGQSRTNVSFGHPDGLFGMLLRNEADLAIGDTEITMERAQNFDFSSPVLNTRFSVLYKAGNDSVKVTTSYWTIFNPFPIAVWIPFVVISIFYFGFLKFHQFRFNPAKIRSFQKLEYSRKFAQLVLFVWILFLLTCYISTYAAQKVTQAITVNNAHPATLVDLASQKDIKIGWLARGPVERFFRNTVNELYQKIYMQNVGRDWVLSNSEGVNKVISENGKFAFILDSIAADHETQFDCTLYKLPHEFGPVRPIAVATPIGSSLRERINQAVLSLSEQGITEALHNRWFSVVKNEQCSVSKGELSTNNSVQEMLPVFILAVVGLFVALVIGLLEIQFLRRKASTLPPQPKPPRQQQAELLPKFNLESV